MADSMKAKVRNIFSVVFNHAIRYEWLAQGKNPIALVRQSANRQRDPVVLRTERSSGDLGPVGTKRSPDRYALGHSRLAAERTRRSEIGRYKFREMQISIQRSIYLGAIGNCKTETSRKPVPIDERAAADLWLGNESSWSNDASLSHC
jgi:integrase